MDTSRIHIDATSTQDISVLYIMDSRTGKRRLPHTRKASYRQETFRSCSREEIRDQGLTLLLIPDKLVDRWRQLPHKCLFVVDLGSSRPEVTNDSALFWVFCVFLMLSEDEAFSLVFIELKLHTSLCMLEALAGLRPCLPHAIIKGLSEGNNCFILHFGIRSYPDDVLGTGL